MSHIIYHKILPQVSNSSLKSVQILPESFVQMHPKNGVKGFPKWLKDSLNAFFGGGDPVVTSSIYSLDLLSKFTLCPNPPGSPLLVIILPCKPWLIFHTQPVYNTRTFRMHDNKRTWQTPLSLCSIWYQEVLSLIIKPCIASSQILEVMPQWIIIVLRRWVRRCKQIW